MQRRPIPLITAGAAALAFAFAPSPAHASSSQFSIFEAPREVLGFDDPLRQQTLDQIKELGVTHTRVLVQWSFVLDKPNAKTKPANLAEKDPDSAGYNFAKYDAIFKEAADRGIEVIPTITGDAPKWATAGKRGKNYKPDRNAFERFVEAVGSRYGDKVNTWTIWNEPNQPQFLNPQFVKKKPYSPLLYRALYQAALQGLGATGNGSDKVLAGETSPAGNSNIVAPITFAKTFFKGRKLKVDGYAHHPYTKKAGPFYKPKSVDVTIGSLTRLTKALDRYSHHKRLKLYLTEFGIQSKPDPNYGVTQTRQAEYRSISEKIAYSNSRVAAFSQYLMRDDLPRGKGSQRYSGFESGILTSKGKKKLAFEGYRLPLVVDRGRLWGLVRPATGATTVTVQFRDKGAWKDLTTVKTNSRGYWTKKTTNKKGRVFRVEWETFTGPTTHSYSAP